MYSVLCQLFIKYIYKRFVRYVKETNASSQFIAYPSFVIFLSLKMYFAFLSSSYIHLKLKLHL